MPRETKLERLERENRDLREEIETSRAWALREHTERARLSARCSFLYEQGLELGTELIKLRLWGR